MTLRALKGVLVITNLLLITLPIVAIVASYFFLGPKVIDLEADRWLDIELGVYSIAFASWGLLLILTSICLLGVVFSRMIVLHLLAALILCLPLTLTIWLIVEQFLFREKLNPAVLSICFAASILWVVQILCELILACYLCCGSPQSDDEKNVECGDADEGQEEGKKKMLADNQQEEATEEEMEKLVLSANEGKRIQPTIVRDDDDPESEDEEGDQTDQRQSPDPADLSNRPDGGGQHPQELPLETIPEERQHLLNSGGGVGPGNAVTCPLATPEDTGV